LKSEIPQENFALVAFIGDPIKAERNLQKLLAQTKNFCQILQLSSIYKRDHENLTNVHSHTSELVVAARVSTALPRQEFSDKIMELKMTEASVTSYAILLSMNREILMTPGFTLPDPRLVQDRLILLCAAEVWGDYEHPVLGQSLTELVKLYPVRDRIEFFNQGTYLY